MMRRYSCPIMRFLTVLLAEDEPVISIDIKHLLEGKGHAVIQAYDLQAIMDACEQQQPDLAILNYKHHESRDGMALAQVLKQRFKLPVMLVTGARPQDIAASIAFDSSLDILYKPFTAVQLHHCLHKHSGL